MNKKFKTIIFSAMAIFLFGCGNSETDEGELKSSNMAQDFQLVTLNGEHVSLSDYKGKALLLNVWDTWCPPCRAELPYFIELYSQYKSKGLEILGVAGARYGRDNVINFIRKNGINYPNTIITNEFANSYGPIQGIPTTFLIDPQGEITQKYVGPRPKAVFEADIKAALKL